MRTVGLLATSVVVFGIIAWPVGVRAQAPTDPALRLHEAATLSSIDLEGTSPWHLKLDVQLYDAKGKPTEQGTIEEWWAGPGLRHVVYTTPSFSGSYIRNKDGLFLSSATLGPAILDDLLEQVVHPMPHEEEIDRTKPELRKQKFGKIELDCIMLDQPLKSAAPLPLGLFPTYCLDPGKSSLRITTELGSVTFIRNRVGTFQKHQIATDIAGDEGGVEVASAHVSALATATLSDTDFVPDKEMIAATEKLTRISGGVMAGNILTKQNPSYPEQAKHDHVSGSVILHALIGRDGRVQSLHILGAPDSDLAIAAIAAVRKWTYKPYLLNGLPTEVDTTITVNFSFGPG